MKKSRIDPKIGRLKWVVNFLNADLEKLDRGNKRLYIYLGLESFALNEVLITEDGIYEYWLPETLYRYIDLPGEIWEKASLIQMWFRAFFDPVVLVEEKDFQPPAKYTEEQRSFWKEIMDRVLFKLPPMQITLSMHITSDRRFHLLTAPTERTPKSGLFFEPSVFKDENEWLKSTLENSALLNCSPEYYLFMLARLLDNVPYNWIRKCKGKNKDGECGRYFLNPSGRIKEYCNSSCASRSIQRNKREQLKQDEEKYQAHKKKMNEYMKKRYRKKVLGQQ
jgi:hypothetical protein